MAVNEPVSNEPVSNEPNSNDLFAIRHIGPAPDQQAKMLAALGFATLDEFIDQVVPRQIRSTEPLAIPAAMSERAAAQRLREIAALNTPMRSMIGLGYYDTITPSVLRRNILENPAWYTAYTPYQPEISQGRLEALLNYQTMVADLCGLDLANASLLDEATAVAEAMTLARRVSKVAADAPFLVDADTHPQTLAVLATRAEPLGLRVETFSVADGIGDVVPFGILISQPGSSGRLTATEQLRGIADAVHERGGLVTATTDLFACTLIAPPGEWGADVAVGSSQRFGVPMGNGGPHAAFMAVRDGLERSLPGRIVGTSVDADGAPAHRLALQTREQHIRRERATSNICTAQVLLAVIAGAYAVYHGPEGLTRIAQRIHGRAATLGSALDEAGIEITAEAFFDTVTTHVPGRAAEVVAAAEERGIDLRHVDADHVAIACDETTSLDDLGAVLAAFGVSEDRVVGAVGVDRLGAAAGRQSAFCTAAVFGAHRSETSMMRYLRRLADADLALDRTMIPLGSCTMKLNAAAEMEPISWPEFAQIHPFAPAHQRAGYSQMIADLEDALCAITGYAAVSLQPNAGSQGELAGLLAVRAWHRSRGELGRDVCLIPSSAHGTNAASATMAGMRVIVVACDERGNVDVDDLRAKIAKHGGELAALMITYPSTHGVFEEAVVEICDLVHEAGGQVYLDGANLNAMVGLARPGAFGADVSHLNLHKTFCIPHGGGGPGIGPVAVAAHLAPFLPNHPTDPAAGPETGIGPVAAAPAGSAGILPIPWMYLQMMGPIGLTEASKVAVLSANYIAARLGEAYPVLYVGESGHVAHECILDLRGITKATGVSVDDVAKRLIDHGFHAPTMSFPVAGTLMVEPTESEDLDELDRFCDAMLAIRAEIDRVAAGGWPADDNPLVNAPHTAAMLLGEWGHPYSPFEAAYPSGTARTDKYFPPVRRIDGVYGDRNLVCSCPPIDAYADQEDAPTGASDPEAQRSFLQAELGESQR
ncbi:MAG TPA: aminomethyl-transferring glycine dehydrogenase [Acidimicrobiales bacterium]|nr:aminomethyl-transferring glycine dehydrogenase [Acidimicrobiales bacterium]